MLIRFQTASTRRCKGSSTCTGGRNTWMAGKLPGYSFIAESHPFASFAGAFHNPDFHKDCGTKEALKKIKRNAPGEPKKPIPSTARTKRKRRLQSGENEDDQFQLRTAVGELGSPPVTRRAARIAAGSCTCVGDQNHNTTKTREPRPYELPKFAQRKKKKPLAELKDTRARQDQLATPTKTVAGLPDQSLPFDSLAAQIWSPLIPDEFPKGNPWTPTPSWKATPETLNSNKSMQANQMSTPKHVLLGPRPDRMTLYSGEPKPLETKSRHFSNDLPTRAHSLKTGASATNFPGQDAVQTPTRHRYQSSAFLPKWQETPESERYFSSNKIFSSAFASGSPQGELSKLSPLPVFVRSNSSCSVAPTRLVQNISSPFYLPFVGMAGELSNALGLAGDERH